MRLLFDANLSPRLVSALADAFSACAHVQDFGGLAGEDLLIWAHAKDHDFTIVSKDSDFHRMSFVLGPPPKVIWLRLGNCTTLAVEHALRDNLEAIARFEKDEGAAFLIIEPRS